MKRILANVILHSYGSGLDECELMEYTLPEIDKEKKELDALMPKEWSSPDIVKNWESSETGKRTLARYREIDILETLAAEEICDDSDTICSIHKELWEKSLKASYYELEVTLTFTDSPVFNGEVKEPDLDVSYTYLVTKTSK